MNDITKYFRTVSSKQMAPNLCGWWSFGIQKVH